MPPQHVTRRAAQIKGRHRQWHEPTDTLPRVPLVLMAATGFITYLTESLPVGVMQNMRADAGLGLSEGMIGQLVTIYAVGCGVAAIPTTLATRHLPRRSLLLTVLGAFVVANAGTGLATAFWVMALCRAAAGVCAGLLWAMLAGYATRLVTSDIQGKAMALAMAGTPMALSFGTPLGALLGDAVGWRMAFLVASALAGVAGVLGAKLLPKVPGEVPEPGERSRSVIEVVMLPGLLAVIAVTGIYSVGHNAAYTFVPSLAAASGVTVPVGTLLLVFGVAAAVGLYLVGRGVDAHLRELTIGVCALLGVALTILGLVAGLPMLAVPAMALWGLAFGGAPTLFQTASARICGGSQEVGQALIVTTYNCSAALAAAIGGVLVDGDMPLAVPWFGVLCAVGSAALVVTAGLAFPSATRSRRAVTGGDRRRTASGAGERRRAVAAPVRERRRAVSEPGGESRWADEDPLDDDRWADADMADAGRWADEDALDDDWASTGRTDGGRRRSTAETLGEHRWADTESDDEGRWASNNLDDAGRRWSAAEPVDEDRWADTERTGERRWGATESDDERRWAATESAGESRRWSPEDPLGDDGWSVEDPLGDGGWSVEDPLGDGGWAASASQTEPHRVLSHGGDGWGGAGSAEGEARYRVRGAASSRTAGSVRTRAARAR